MIRMPRFISRAGSLLAAALLVGVSPPAAQAQNCQAFGFATVCVCTKCLYTVLCSVTIGGVPNLSVSICEGDNPGMVVAHAKSSFSGLTGTTCYLNFGCGTATLTATCCGGARTRVADWGIYSTCLPAGTICGTSGTVSPQL